MKKHIQYQLLTLLFLAASFTTFAQVGLGTTSPEGALDVVSTNSGIILPRVANTAAVTTPVNGMMIYDLSSNCLKAYENSSWTSCLSSVPCPTTATVVINGAPTIATCGGLDIALSSSYTSADTYAWTADNGATFDDATSATPNLTLPNTDVNVTVNLTITKAGCSPTSVTATPVTINVDVEPAVSITGVKCLDVEITDSTVDPLSIRQQIPDDFTNLSYTVGTSSGATGFTWSWVSNPGNNGTINSGGTTHTADVTFNKTTPAVGDYVLQVEMTGFACGTITRNITINIQDAHCDCIVPISATEFKYFLCHNSGADTSLDPHVPVVGLHGAYIQWGKRGPNTTGNSTVDWQTAANDGSLGFAAAPTATNANAGTISGWDTAYVADGAWNSGTEAAPVKTVNEPCPTGYRVPTRNEWVGVANNNTASRTGTFSSSSTNYGSALHFGPDASTKLLTLPAPGWRDYDGLLRSRGNIGYYWSSTEKDVGTYSYHIAFNGSVVIANAETGDRTSGYSLRCIAE